MTEERERDYLAMGIKSLIALVPVVGITWGAYSFLDSRYVRAEDLSKTLKSINETLGVQTRGLKALTKRIDKNDLKADISYLERRRNGLRARLEVRGCDRVPAADTAKVNSCVEIKQDMYETERQIDEKKSELRAIN